MEKVFLDNSREEELSETVRNFPVLQVKYQKRFKEKDAVNNAKDGVATALEFIQIGNYFNFKPFISFCETILFIQLNPLEPGVLDLNSQYHLVLPFTMF